MKSKSHRRHLGFYCLLGTLACGLAVGCKVLFVWGFDTYIYSLPIVGGVLASLEVVEITSPILMALLGLALGALTYYLPTDLNLGPRLLLLILATPLVLLVGHKVRHNIWINQVSTQESISLGQAKQLTDNFLEQETSKSGSLGFYWYTAEQATPPTRLSNLETLDDANLLQNQLTDFGRQQTGLLGLAFGFYNWLFSQAGWGIRTLYALLSGFMGLSYFYKGQRWAERRLIASVSRAQIRR